MPDAILLREVAETDLPIFYDQQLDPDANFMAAFTAEDPADRDAFAAHWHRILGNPTITVRTILAAGQVAGYVASFVRFGEREVSYWIGKETWGQGVATGALAAFLDQVTERPLYARAAQDNLVSLRVLAKCGFTPTGTDKAFAHARGQEVEEVILRLDTGPRAP